MLDRVSLQPLHLVVGSLATALYTLAALTGVLGLVCYLAYRRLRRDGRWNRVMGRSDPARPRSDPALATLQDQVERAIMTVQGALKLTDAASLAGHDLAPEVAELERAGRHLHELIDLVAVHAGPNATPSMVVALTQPVNHFAELARQHAEGSALALGSAAAFELDGLSTAALQALSNLDYRRAALNELGRAL